MFSYGIIEEPTTATQHCILITERDHNMKKLLTITLLVSYLLTFNVVIAEPSSILPIEGVEMTYQEYAASLVSEDQRDAFFELINAESGWNPLAQNPNSTAFGIGQFLNSTWITVGCEKTTDPQIQLDCMIKYIEINYKTPVNAWRFHQSQSPHWY